MKTLLFVIVEQIGKLKYQLDTDEAEGGNLRKLKELFELLAQMQMRGDLEIGVMEGESILLSDRVSEREVNPTAIITADSAGYYYKPTSNGNYELRKKSGFRYAMMMRYRDAREADKVESYLGIDPKAERPGEDGLSRVVELSTGEGFGRKNGKKGDIPVLSIGLRSFQQVLLDVSAGVDLPPYESDIKGRDIVANPIREYMKPVIHVKCSSAEPSNDLVSIFYRGNWFYIDDDDVQSKITFDLIEVLFSLKAAEKQGVIPMLTIPVR